VTALLEEEWDDSLVEAVREWAGSSERECGLLVVGGALRDALLVAREALVSSDLDELLVDLEGDARPDFTLSRRSRRWLEGGIR